MSLLLSWFQRKGGKRPKGFLANQLGRKLIQASSKGLSQLAQESGG